MEAPPSGAGEVGEAIFLVLRVSSFCHSRVSRVSCDSSALGLRPAAPQGPGDSAAAAPRGPARAPPPQSARSGCPLGSPWRSPGRSPSRLPAPTYLPAGRLGAMAGRGLARPWPRGWADGGRCPEPRSARVSECASGGAYSSGAGRKEAASLAAAAIAKRAMSSWTAPRNMSICTTDCRSSGGGWGKGGSSAGAPASQADVPPGGPRPAGHVQLFPANLHSHPALSIHAIQALPVHTHSPPPQCGRHALTASLHRHIFFVLPATLDG